MSNVKVSVVMCCYNEQRYIRESIESVLSQTYKDFEFIIWNDGSSDKTEEIIKSYDDSRIRYFYHENTGLGEALRLACQEARGEYIARMDCDDISMPDRFEKQVAFLDSHSDYVLCSSGVYFIDSEGSITGRRFPATCDNVIRMKLNAITHPASMFRTETYRKCGGYHPLRSAQDKILWSHLMRYGKLHNLPLTLLKYREIPNSVSHVLKEGTYYWEMIDAVRRKMCSDEIVSNEDVRLHNEIYAVAKKSYMDSHNIDVPVVRHKSIEERLFVSLKVFVDEKTAISVISAIKNVLLWSFIRIKSLIK